MEKIKPFVIVLILTVIPLYPKFPLLGVTGTFVSVRLEDFLLAACGGFWLVSRLISKKPFSLTPTQKAIGLYLLVGAVAVFSGIFLTKTAGINLSLLHWFRRVEYMSLFFIGYDLATKASAGFIVRTILVVSFLVGLYGIGQQFAGFPIISTTNSEFSKGLVLSLGPAARINSTFAGHYDLAAFSLLPLFVIIGLLVMKKVSRLPLIIMGLPIYWAMLLSASRVTFAAFVVTTAVYLWTIGKRIWLIPLAIISIISIIVTPQLLGRYREFLFNHVVSVIPTVSAQSDEPIPVDEQTADALKPAAAPEDRSLNIRLNAEWPQALRAFEKNPIFGTGFSSIGLASDNDYLRILAETGIVGFAAFCLVCWRIFQKARRFLTHIPTNETEVLIVASTFMFVGLLINAVFIDVFEASKIAIILWLLLGVTQKLIVTYEE